jgi:hypothetical protein
MIKKIRHRSTDADDRWETVIGHDGKPARILKDGRRVRVPAYLRDGRSLVYNVNKSLTDAERMQLASCRPGFRTVDSQHIRERQQFAADARAVAEHEMCEAYKHARSGVGVSFGRYDANGSNGGFRGQQEGDACTVRGPEFPDDFGSPGVLRERNGALVCVPLDNGDDEPLFDASQGGVVDPVEAAYRDHLRFLRDAYKRG